MSALRQPQRHWHPTAASRYSHKLTTQIANSELRL